MITSMTKAADLIQAMRETCRPAPVSEQLALDVLDSHRTVGTTLNYELRGKAATYAVIYDRLVRERLKALESRGLVRSVEGCCGRGLHWETVS